MAVDPIKLDLARKVFEENLARVKLRFDQNATKAMFLWSSGTINQLLMKRLSGRPGLRRLGGTLADSFRHREEGSTIADATTRIFSTAIYAPVHEYGATIRPKHAKFLIFPKPGGGAVNAKGIPLFYGPKRLSQAPKGSFVFAKKVYVPPRLKFSETVKARLKVLRDGLKAAFNAAKKGGA